MASEYQGLLVDYGGVLTTNLFESFGAFCRGEGLEPDVVVRQFAGNREARELLIELECGRMGEEEFERRLAGMLEVDPEGLIDRMFAGSGPDLAMRSAVAAARRAGVRTGLISNSWVDRHYDTEMLDGLFDGVVISAREGIRKPAPRMYELGAERIGVAPAGCVYVDDLPFNLEPAAELGMATIHHVDPQRTIAELERLLGVPLARDPAA
ncbi:MAG TPA: HAD-IA family hydrolase [Solirubrobacteraceae bacterium]|nr:HAD-IA family hydrolase [Solirubrobacteraceae bacterium]